VVNVYEPLQFGLKFLLNIANVSEILVRKVYLYGHIFAKTSLYKAIAYFPSAKAYEGCVQIHSWLNIFFGLVTI